VLPAVLRRKVHMRRNRAWRALTTVLVVLAAAVLTVIAPGTASAAPDCNSFTSYSSVGGYMRVPTIGRETGAYNCELGRGNNSDAVRVLQASLNRCFWQNLVVDGDFGPKTQQAVRNAQMMLNSWYDPDIAVDGRHRPTAGPHSRGIGGVLVLGDRGSVAPQRNPH
jgi:hypothetical protein